MLLCATVPLTKYFCSCFLVLSCRYQHLKGKTKCLYCPAGYFSQNTTKACQACLTGMYQNQDGVPTQECKACESGKQFTMENKACRTCTVGLYNPTKKISATCLACPAGFEYVSKILCTQCAAGKYQGQNSEPSVKCNSCSEGRYAKDSVVLACSICSLGQVQVLKEAVSHECSVCSIGTSSSGATESCAPCNEGKYQLDDVALKYNACKTCRAGRASLSKLTPCVDCSNGQYQEHTPVSCSFGFQKTPTHCHFLIVSNIFSFSWPSLVPHQTCLICWHTTGTTVQLQTMLYWASSRYIGVHMQNLH